MNCCRSLILLSLVALFLAGCETLPSSRVHASIKQDPASRALQQVVLMPVDVDVFEMSAGGIKEEVPEWSRIAQVNVRNALLISAGSDGGCCVTRSIDSATLTQDEQEMLEEHLALFNRVAASALWTALPANSAWHFKNTQFDYTLGDGLSFLKTKYGLDGALIVMGEDVVSTAGRKATALVGAVFGLVVPMGHSFLAAGLVDFTTGDLLWMNHELSGGDADLRDGQSCRKLVVRLMRDYPVRQAATGDNRRTGN